MHPLPSSTLPAPLCVTISGRVIPSSKPRHFAIHPTFYFNGDKDTVNYVNFTVPSGDENPRFQRPPSFNASSICVVEALLTAEPREVALDSRGTTTRDEYDFELRNFFFVGSKISTATAANLPTPSRT
jgi:hypothetical protein